MWRLSSGRHGRAPRVARRKPYGRAGCAADASERLESIAGPITLSWHPRRLEAMLIVDDAAKAVGEGSAVPSRATAISGYTFW